MMWRRLMLVALVAMLFAPPAREARAGQPSADPIRVMVNGYCLGLDVAPVIENGRVQVPWRWLAEFYGFTVHYRPEDQVIATTNLDRSIVMYINQTEALVDGRAISLHPAPRIVQRRALVPLGFIAEALGFTVDWDEGQRSVLITGDGPRAGPLPALTPAEIRTVRRGITRPNPRKYAVYSMPGDRDRLTGLVAAWAGAIPAVHPGMMAPMPPYGTKVIIELENGTASVEMAWSCQEAPEGGRTCRDNDSGFVYLYRDGDRQGLHLVYAPGLADFIRTFPEAGE